MTNNERQELIKQHFINPIPCPKCKGDKTKFCHQCWGWGVVEKDSPDAACVHKFNGKITRKDKETYKEISLYNSAHAMKCSKCGHIKIYDSSG